MKIKLFILLFLAGVSGATAQHVSDSVKGAVYEVVGKKDLSPIPGVSVYWANSNMGTTTDSEGRFKLKTINDTHELVVKSIGFTPDTIHVHDFSEALNIVLKEGNVLKDVEVVYRKGSLSYLTLSPRNTQVISTDELRKAACCNLSESFETNPSVDASFTDAVTGTKQIQMLGLAGKYTQIMQENIPTIRGLSSVYGLEYIPGAWINSIYLSKGAGSVVNGYESVTGQINVDMKKPGNAEKFHLNVYGNQGSRLELNAYYDKTVGKYWETTVLVHGKNQSTKFDRNNDGFVDNPLTNNFIAHNQWHYVNPNSPWRVEVGAGGVSMNTKAGTLSSLDPDNNVILSNSVYGVQIKTARVNGFVKAGYLFKNEDYKSLGQQLSGMFHDQSSHFGITNYGAQQTNFLYNLIFQDEIGESEKHFYKTGVSVMYDDYNVLFSGTTLDRTEIVPGAYGEYNYDNGGSISVIAGLRGDYNTLYSNFFVTPRLHTRYSFDENTSVKLGVGRGQRTPNVVAENIGLLATSRRWNFVTNPVYNTKGIVPEVAWNVGLNFTKKFRWDYRDGTFAVDLYRTDFENQLVIDVDANPQEVNIYNLVGKSYSNSVQAEFNYELFKRFDVRLAYRWLKVERDQLSGNFTKALLPEHRGFVNLAFETKKNPVKMSKWQYDLTTQIIGEQRLPNTSTNPVEFRLAENSPSYVMFNAQITRIFSETFDVYLGVENILNYTQDKPILSSSNPNSAFFDSSIVWAPIFGRMAYIGLRFTIK